MRVDAAELDRLIGIAGRLLGASFLDVVDSSLYYHFRSDGLALLLKYCGPEHPLYREFNVVVRDNTRRAVEAGADVLRRLHEASLKSEARVAIVGFNDLLHPVISKASLSLFETGHYRDAVFTSIVAVFDLLRERSGIQLDGSALATQCFSLSKPKLVIADLETESGRNEQVGFMQLLQG